MFGKRTECNCICARPRAARLCAIAALAAIAALHSTAAFAQPVNDSCDSAIQVFTGPNAGGNNCAASTTDEFEVTCQANSNRDVFYTWTADCTGQATIDTEGSAFTTSNDTVLTVYEFDCFGPVIACDDDGGTGALSTVTFDAFSGSTYIIRVAGWAANCGEISLNIACLGNDSPQACCSDTFDGTNACQDLSENDCFAIGGNPLGLGTSCAVEGAQCVGACCDPTESGPCLVTTNNHCFNTYFTGILAPGTDCGDCPQPNDSCVGAIEIFDGTTMVDLTTATTSELLACGDFPFGNNFINNDLYYSYTASCDGTLFVDTCGDTDDTRLAIYDVDCNSILGGAPPIECNDDHGNATEGDTGNTCAATFNASLSIPVTSGSTYIIAVGNYSGATPPIPSSTAMFPLNIACVGGDTPQACCTELGCSDLSEADCLAIGGNPLGLFTNCGTIVCPSGNDSCAGAIEVFTGANNGGNNCSAVPLDDREASCQGTSNHDVFFTWTADCTGQATIDTIGSLFAPSNDTVLSVYDFDCFGSEIACNDDATGLGGLSSVTFNAFSGSTYIIRVAGFSERCGDISLNIACLGNDTPQACCSDTADGLNACQDLSENDCFAIGGNPLGLGTSCAVEGAQCVGSCCDPAMVQPCLVTTNNHCLSLYGNLIVGPGTDCSDCPPPNDTCDTAIEVFTGTNTGTNNCSASEIDDRENGCPLDSNHDVFFTWTADCTGQATIDTEGSMFAPSNDTMLSVYDFDCFGSEIECDDDDGTGLLSTITFNVFQGSTYIIRVAGYSANCGDITLNISCIDAESPQACCSDTVDGVNACQDLSENDCFAIGGNPLGLGTSCAVEGAQCVGACCDPAMVQPCLVTTNNHCLSLYGNLIVGPGTDCSDCPPPNDSCDTAIEVFTGTNTGTGNCSTSEIDDREASCQGSSNQDVFFTWTADCTGQAIIDTEGSSFDTVLSVYDADCFGPEIACDDDGGTGLLSTVTIDVFQGSTYIIRVGGYLTGCGPITLNIGCFSAQAPQACCTELGCSDLSSDDCAVLGGFPLGIGTSCGTHSCPPQNESCFNPEPVTCETGTIPGLTLDFSFNDHALPAGSQCTGFGTTGPEIVYAFTPDADVEIVAGMANVFGFDASFYVVTDCNDLEGSCVAGDDTGVDEEVTFLANAGVTYYLIADSWTTTPAPGTLFDFYIECATASACATCPGDVNGDNEVNGLDIQSFVACHLAEFGLEPSAGCACADASGNLLIDTADVAAFVDLLLNSTGECDGSGGGGGENPACGVPGSGLCISTPNGNPATTGTAGCEDAACCDLVCAQDSFCCDIEYDAICQAEGRGLCSGDPTIGCDLGITGCFDMTVEDCTALGGINIGPDCGGGGGGPCGNPGSGLCISTPDGNPVTTGTPGCEDAACCELVCAQDPFCCNDTYDSFCQAEGRGLCTGDPTVPCDVGFACAEITAADCAALSGTVVGACP